MDNWKSSRRKRVEHIIDRVVEVKKYELEEHDRNRRKSKTFNEMMEERGSRRLKPLPIYSDDDNNDLSDLGIGSSDSSSKAAMLEQSDQSKEQLNNGRSSSNADLNEYTYEGAIEDYKSRISRAGHLLTDTYSRCDSDQVEQTVPSLKLNADSVFVEPSATCSEDKKCADACLPEVPKIDFLKRKELFEKEQGLPSSECELRRQSSDFVSTISIKERLSVLQLNQAQDPSENDKNQRKLPDVSFSDLKNRLEVFEREIRNLSNERDSNVKTLSLTPPECTMLEQSSNKQDTTEHNTKSSIKTLESVISVTAVEKSRHGDEFSDKPSYDSNLYNVILSQKQTIELDDNENMDTDREDSGIHTTDVSCSVSQADDQNEEVEHHVEDPTADNILPRDDFNGNGSFPKHNERSFESDGYIHPDGDEADDVNILDDALEMAFQEIDNMESTLSVCPQNQEPIYQNISDIEKESSQADLQLNSNMEVEPYYQVPKSQEPYYEVPKTKPIPLYENVDMLHSVPIISDTDVAASEGVKFTLCLNNLQPPKEKPPPPPVEKIQEGENSNEASKDNFKRINSTKRIKKEIRNKRSSFLGIETASAEDDALLELSVAPPPRVTGMLQDERILEKQLLIRSGLHDNSDTAESRDSGVSENHSRQSSDLFTASSDDPEDLIKPKVGDQKVLKFNEFGDHHIGHLKMSETFQQEADEESRHRSIRKQIREQESFNLIPHFIDATYDSDQSKELKNSIPPPIPPAKPLRSPQYLHHQYNLYSEHRKSLSNVSNLDYGQLRSNTMSLSENQIAYHNACNNADSSSGEFLPLHLSDQSRFCNNSHVTNNASEATGNVTKLKPISDWSPHRTSYEHSEFGSDVYPLHKNMLRQRSYTECSPQWNVRPSRHTSQNNDSYSRHWFVQEAEQRRIEQQANTHYASGFHQNKNSSRKSLPESVIQTITQRVQDLGIGTDRRWQAEGPSPVRMPANENGIKSNSIQSHQNHVENDEKVLSVSGKKKCSHCNNELGRGAAMVIESLGLLYHIDCFKCCVCHTRLGDGFKGTDVRVRKYKLHCQNCFSSEDGVKFSCV